MADLVLDTQVLVDCGKALRVVADEFEHASSRSDDAADAVGHPQLAERLREFAHNWDDRRKELLANIASIAQAATDVGGAFEQLDTDLAAAIKGEKQ